MILPKLPSSGKRSHWSALHGSGLALTVAEAAQANAGLSLLITGTTLEAEVLASEISFLSPEQTVLLFPDRETLPYDSFSPHQDIISQRLSTLYQLPGLTHGLLITPVTTLMHRLAPREYVLGQSLVLEVGQKESINQLAMRLEGGGYHRVETVFEHGEYAVRGSLLDVFPMGSNQPYRIDFFDDEIEELRSFEPESQRTEEKLQRISLLPAREVPLNPSGIKHFKESWYQYFQTDHRQCSIYQDVSDGIAPAGIEYYLPLFFEKTQLLTDYLPDNTLVFTTSDSLSAAEHFWSDIKTRYDEHNIDARRPLLPPNVLFASGEELFSQLKIRPRINLHRDRRDPQSEANPFSFEPLPDLAVDARSTQPWGKIEDFVQQQEYRVLFCAESAGRRQALLEQLNNHSLKPVEVDSWAEFRDGSQAIAIASAPLDRGMLQQETGIAVITEAQIYGQRVLQSRRRQKAKDDNQNVIRNLAELRPDAPVVHIDHGVGRYLGLHSLHIDGQDAEFVTLAYAEGAKLYVPVASLHLISRYSGSENEFAPLHRLGNEQWSKAKEKAAREVRDTAAELLEIYARRAARPGTSITVSQEAYQGFTAGFPFEETIDQETSILSVIKDMAAATPMDRLVCGDVGFGKTEVAMRAAFISAYNGYQVAVLVPTTLLAQQHFENFRDRFADWPISIEVLSRFRSTKELNDVRSRIADGKVDIVIGTHKLLQPDITFKQLGLLIIDEEHRFGVKHKETFKALRAKVDILTLTATPIPRTLNMAMSGIRDLSIIATPPARRLSVKTFVRNYENGVIKEAVLREILRGGQVFFLHNEVKSIEKCARELEELIPEARIAVAHGQLRERELEQVMSDFYHKKFNILVCSTIIETGIDIPSANTIIIERADKFGLAQLHQLRGRVGRSHHQAYAYLLTPDNRMSKDASKRLDAIAETSDLGAGFTLATHDMEIRGAGELLGDDQSGHIQTIGFTMYMDMLNRAVDAAQRGETIDLEKPLNRGMEINLRIPALIPDDYLPDVHTRLTLYKRLSDADSLLELKELQVEMIDRFGLLPDEAKYLMRVTELKILALPLGLTRVEANAKGGRFEFSNNTNIDPMCLIKLVQQEPTTYKLSGGNQLVFEKTMMDAESRISTVFGIMEYLQQGTVNNVK
ncbi:MAG: transcription-repair coupling factor [Pseudomonadales bacterium]